MPQSRLLGFYSYKSSTHGLYDIRIYIPLSKLYSYRLFTAISNHYVAQDLTSISLVASLALASQIRNPNGRFTLRTPYKPFYRQLLIKACI